MSDDTTATDAPAAEEAPTTQATAPAAPPAQEDTPKGETIDPETARKLRSEAKNLRDAKKQAEAEAADLRQKVEAFEAEKLSETERLQQQAEKATEAATAAAARAKSANLRAAVAIAANEHGIDAEAARKLIADEVTFTDDDEPENVPELIGRIVESGVLASKNAAPTGGLPANAQGGNPKPNETDAEALARIYRNARGDAGADAAWGGGVIINNG